MQLCVGGRDFDVRLPQGFIPIQQKYPYTVEPGDAFHTVCNYRSQDNEIGFGFSAQQEMCLVVLMYYPRQPSFAHCGRNFRCAANYSSRILERAEETDRRFGNPLDICPVREVPEDGGNSGAMAIFSAESVLVLVVSVFFT